jgi:putative membrane protein
VTQPAEPGPLRRLHPLSPLLRGWKFIIAALLVIVPQNADRLRRSADEPLSLALAVLAVVAVGVIYGLLSWRFTHYGVAGGDLRVDSGVLFRRSRHVRLDRLQAVEVVQPLLGRALGLAELRLEVVGGAKTEAPLAYLSLDDARRLRAELLARAAGIAEDTPEAPERVLHEVPAERLLWSSLLSTPVLVGVLLVPVALAAAALTAGIGAALVLVPALVSVGTPLIQQLVANYGFTLAESPDGLRVRRGLLETRSQTVPPGRIQAARLAEPWLWRRFTDWVAVQVDIAGYAGESATASAVLLPVGPRPLALDLLRRVLPDADVSGVPLTGVPPRARWLAPLSRRVLAAGADRRHFVARRGVLRRETDVVPHERAQSVRLSQGPLQRWLRLATVTVDTTPGPVTVRAEHRDAVEAAAMVRAEAILARAARAAAPPQRWMRRV